APSTSKNSCMLSLGLSTAGNDRYQDKENAMFLLNNTLNRRYGDIYSDVRDVVFDLSERQLKNRMNRDWRQIVPGSIACVIDGSKQVNAFHVIHDSRQANGLEGTQYVITGAIVATLSSAQPLNEVLRRP